MVEQIGRDEQEVKLTDEGMVSRAAFTIAVGKPIFLRMAVALARSFFLWNRGNGIEFAVITDKPRTACPDDLADVITWVEVPPGTYGTGFTPKLFLDEMAPAEHSLFIDADCLCVRSLESVFDRFEGRQVSVVGTNWSEGEWFGDVAAICKTLDILHYPYLNGGIYYLEPGPVATKIFEKARALREDYDEIGFVRLRDRENDEVLISVSMAIFGQDPLPEDGTIMNTVMDAPGGMELDVLNGRATLYNPADHPQKARGHEVRVLRPAIMHLNDMDIIDYLYSTQTLIIELAMGRRWPIVVARLVSFVRCTLPAVTLRTARQLLRPLHHALFGPRRVRPMVR